MAKNQDSVDKNKHGANGMSSLEQMIETLKARDYICSSQRKYRVADPEYGDDQFYFQFLIEFQDKEQWLLHSTTSIRDRIAEQQWHSEHIKRLNEYVKKAYVVVPDELDKKEKGIAESYNRKIQEGHILSAIDGVISFQDAYREIEHKATGLMDPGQAKAKLGLHFEEKLVDALNNDQNLQLWKNQSTTATGYLYKLFIDVMHAVNVSPNEVLFLKASSQIPKLPSGGSPKTDVYLEIEMLSGRKSFTFSCKRSTEDRVSVHEYTANAFANVLNPEDGELRTLLAEFQEVGGVRAMNPIRAELLEKRLRRYSHALSEWVLGGIGGEGDKKVQWASHIITVNENSNTYKVASIDDYITECERNGIEGQLGTLFQWTYPSGGKGKRIQLKGKMI